MYDEDFALFNRLNKPVDIVPEKRLTSKTSEEIYKEVLLW